MAFYLRRITQSTWDITCKHQLVGGLTRLEDNRYSGRLYSHRCVGTEPEATFTELVKMENNAVARAAGFKDARDMVEARNKRIKDLQRRTGVKLKTKRIVV